MTLSLLAVVARMFHDMNSSMIVSIMMVYSLILPVCLAKASLNADTKDILVSGWTPVLSAMVISSMGGKILNQVIVR